MRPSAKATSKARDTPGARGTRRRLFAVAATAADDRDDNPGVEEMPGT